MTGERVVGVRNEPQHRYRKHRSIRACVGGSEANPNLPRFWGLALRGPSHTLSATFLVPATPGWDRKNKTKIQGGDLRMPSPPFSILHVLPIPYGESYGIMILGRPHVRHIRLVVLRRK